MMGVRKKTLTPSRKALLQYLIINFNVLTLGSNCGTKLRMELGC
jgi:hypothetical protein